MRRFLGMICAVLALGAGAVQAQQQAVVVELFTSQGCSSCPPADALLGDLAGREDVIALSFHVDYWDYLGWEDTFAQAAYTQRQRAYAPKVDRQYIGRRLRGSFTPEIVVQGRDSLVGSHRKLVEDRIAAHAALAPQATVGLARDGGDLVVEVAAVGASSPAVRVMLAQFTAAAEVGIDRGENAGKTFVYHNVVTDLRDIGRWDGTGSQTMRVSGTTGPVAVFLQRGETGVILAGAKLD